MKRKDLKSLKERGTACRLSSIPFGIGRPMQRALEAAVGRVKESL
jgi:hypothetical protein